jgi:hypothetical protein
VKVAVDRYLELGGIGRSLWIPGRVFYAVVVETVIIKVGGEALVNNF